MRDIHDTMDLPLIRDNPYYTSPSSTLSSDDQASLLMVSPSSAIPMYGNYSSIPDPSYFSMPFPDMCFNPTYGLPSNDLSLRFTRRQSATAAQASVDLQTIQRCLDPSLVFGASYQSADHFKASLSPAAHPSPTTPVDSVLALTPPLEAITDISNPLTQDKNGTSPLAVTRDVVRPPKASLGHAGKLHTKVSHEADSVLQGRKRSRTAQACEKCRIRKARVSLTCLSLFLHQAIDEST